MYIYMCTWLFMTVHALCVHVCVCVYIHVGCFCPGGLVDLDGVCVPPSQCPSHICQLAVDVGPCKYVETCACTFTCNYELCSLLKYNTCTAMPD